MACDLTAGYAEPCKSFIGGIDAVYFVNYGDISSFTLTADQVTDMDGTFSAYKYEVKGAGNNFSQPVTSSRDNGTTFFAQTLNLSLKGLSLAMAKEIKLLAHGRPHIVVQDRNGNAFLVGRLRGAEMTAGDAGATGDAMGDKVGQVMTFVAEEPTPANFIANPTAANPFAGMVGATVTIVTG